MNDESQPRIAILGAGPIGIEVALYARYLGYNVEVFERGKHPAARVLNAGETMLDGPFSDHASRLGVAALMAQDSQWQCPAGSALLSAVEYYHAYLSPLAESDLIADALRLEMNVYRVSLDEEIDWQIFCRDSAGHESVYAAEVVVDATGMESAVFVEDTCPSSDDLSFLNPAADLYVLGSKSRESGETFHFATGLMQIRELFAILGEREDLDVYATMPPIGGRG